MMAVKEIKLELCKTLLLLLLLFHLTIKKTITQCLNSVLYQSYQGINEVIVVHSLDDGTDDLIRQLFPSIKLFHLSKKTFPGAARNVGVRATSSEYITFTDTDCIVDYYWVKNITRRMENGHYVVGRKVINGTLESLSHTLGYLNEFSFYLPWRKSGFVDGLATANVCYRKCVFDTLILRMTALTLSRIS